MHEQNKDEPLLSIETDKLEAEFTLRIPEFTKRKLKELSPQEKKALNEEIIMTMARVLHRFNFDYRKYLKE